MQENIKRHINSEAYKIHSTAETLREFFNEELTKEQRVAIEKTANLVEKAFNLDPGVY